MGSIKEVRVRGVYIHAFFKQRMVKLHVPFPVCIHRVGQIVVVGVIGGCTRFAFKGTVSLDRAPKGFLHKVGNIRKNSIASPRRQAGGAVRLAVGWTDALCIRVATSASGVRKEIIPTFEARVS